MRLLPSSPFASASFDNWSRHRDHKCLTGPAQTATRYSCLSWPTKMKGWLVLISTRGNGFKKARAHKWDTMVSPQCLESKLNTAVRTLCAASGCWAKTAAKPIDSPVNLKIVNSCSTLRSGKCFVPRAQWQGLPIRARVHVVVRDVGGRDPVFVVIRQGFSSPRFLAGCLGLHDIIRCRERISRKDCWVSCGSTCSSGLVGRFGFGWWLGFWLGCCLGSYTLLCSPGPGRLCCLCGFALWCTIGSAFRFGCCFGLCFTTPCLTSMFPLLWKLWRIHVLHLILKLGHVVRCIS